MITNPQGNSSQHGTPISNVAYPIYTNVLNACSACGGIGWHYLNCPYIANWHYTTYPKTITYYLTNDWTVSPQRYCPPLTEQEYFESVDYEPEE